MAKIVQVIIGDEVLSGKIQDLNLKWLATTVLGTSFKLIRSEVVKDNREDIKQAFQNALNDSDIVIVTGGLGPTKDDITKSVLCEFTGSSLKENEQAKNQVILKYREYGKEWSSDKNDYHMIPDKVKPLDNPKGLAPGLHAEIKGKHLFCAPGVPVEFQYMFSDVILPILDTHFPNEAGIEMLNIRTFGIPEEKIFGELCPGLWEKLSEFGSVSSLPHTMNVDITLRLKKDKNLQNNIKKIKDIMSDTVISESIWHYGLEDLPELIVKKASEKNLTFSFAESCTGGLTSSMITNISGSSKPFLGGVVSYSNESKVNILGVSEDSIKENGAVSLEVAKEMAKGIKERTGSDIAISFTGIAGPGGGSEHKPVGTVAIGWAYKNNVKSEILNLKGDRLKLKERFALSGLYKLLKIIESF